MAGWDVASQRWGFTSADDSSVHQAKGCATAFAVGNGLSHHVTATLLGKGSAMVEAIQLTGGLDSRSTVSTRTAEAIAVVRTDIVRPLLR